MTWEIGLHFFRDRVVTHSSLFKNPPLVLVKSANSHFNAEGGKRAVETGMQQRCFYCSQVSPWPLKTNNRTNERTAVEIFFALRRASGGVRWVVLFCRKEDSRITKLSTSLFFCAIGLESPPLKVPLLWLAVTPSVAVSGSARLFHTSAPPSQRCHSAKEGTKDRLACVTCSEGHTLSHYL